MLIEFSVENFKSIKNKVTLNIAASSNKELQKNLLKINLPKSKNTKKEINFLNSVAIFGANASGKTNILLALNQAIFSILFSQTFQPQQLFPIEQFRLDELYLEKPTFFEFKFIKNNIIYIYNFKILKNIIFEENLEYYPNGRRVKVYSRKKNIIEFFAIQNITKEDKIRLKIYKEEISDNILVLSLANKIKIDAVVNAYSWFQNDITCLLNVFDTGWMTSQMLAQKAIEQNLFTNLLKFADFNIEIFELVQKMVPYEELPFQIKEDIKRKIQTLGTNVPIQAGKIEGITYSKGTDKNGNEKYIKFLLEENSAGTLKYYGILGQLIYKLCNGGVLVIDELELRLHPNLTKMIIDLFSSNLNQKQAQLIFTTHCSNLLDTQKTLRRDQIYFVDKNIKGESELYSLLDFNVRNDKVIQKAYLDGIFGAIPNTDLEDLLCK